MLSATGKTRNHLEVLKDVVYALYIRELKTRFGTYRLGAIWAFLEPASFVLLLSAIRSLRSSGEWFGGETHTIPFPIFFMLGYVPYQYFANLLTMGAAAIKANQGLFNYRQVRPIDAILSRTLLETLISSGVLLAFMGFFWWMGMRSMIADPARLFVVFLLLGIFGGGIGMIICVGQLRFPELGKVVPLLTRPLFWISGLFFSLNDIPSQYQHYLLWNPILHAIELIRNACFPSYNASSVSIEFVAFMALLTLFFGLAIYRLDWKRMVAS